MLTALETFDAVWLPVLLDATIKGAALLALAGLVTLCMRRTSAAPRHAVWLLAMVGLLLLPGLSTTLPGWRVLPQWCNLRVTAEAGSVEDSNAESATLPPDSPGEAPFAPDDHFPGESTARATWEPIDMAEVPPVAHASRVSRFPPTPAAEPAPELAAAEFATPGGRPLRALLPWLTGTWLIGFLAATLPILLGRVSLWWLERKARPIVEGPWAELLKRTAGELGIMDPARSRRQLTRIGALLLAVTIAGTAAVIACVQAAGPDVDTSNAAEIDQSENERWGDSVDGLRMAARGKAGESMLWCVIRNHGSQPVRYSDYLLGYFECVSLLARPVGSTNWTKLPQRGHYVQSAGASARNVHVLGAEENMPPPDNWPKPKAAGMSYSFSVDFANFHWPETWRGDLEVVVVQALGNDGSKGTWIGRLSSAPTIVSMDHTPNCPNSVPVVLRSLSAEEGEKPLDKGDGVAAKGSESATSGDPRSVEQLIAALTDEDEQVRLNAIWALGKLGDRRAVEPLIAALMDEDQTVRSNAIQALGNLGDRRAVEPLLVALTPNGGLPAPPIVMTRPITEFDRETGELRFVPGRPSGGESGRPVRDWERMQAAEALAKLADPRAVAPLTEMLGESSDFLRHHAALALARFGRTGFDRLLETLRDEDSPGRGAAAYALGDIGDRRAVEPLIESLGDKNHVLRQHSAVALGKLGDPRAFQPLLDAMKDVEEEEVRAKATEALGKLGDARAVDPLIAALAGEDEYVWTSAARGLGYLGDQRAVGPLITALDCKYSSVQQAAARSLGTLNDPKAVEPIIKLLEHRPWHVRQATAKALGQLGDPRAVGPLNEALAQALKDKAKGLPGAEGVCSEAEKALAKIAPITGVRPCFLFLTGYDGAMA